MVYTSIPPAYLAIPLDDAATPAAWRISILVRQTASGSPELVMLSNPPDSRAFLGCLQDGNGMVRLWLEIWVQNLEGFAAVDTGLEGQLSSQQLDQRWQRHWAAARKVSPAAILLETADKEARPLYLDVSAVKPVHPAAPGGAPWVLCRDDQRLAAAGLPRYSASLWRYLEAATPDPPQPRFVATEKKAPQPAGVTQRTSELGFNSAWLPVNPQGGPMAVRIHPPLDFADYADLLSGATVAEIGRRKRDAELAILLSQLTAGGQDGRRHGLLLGDNNGAEIFYLKLRLLAQAGRALHDHLLLHQCPLLNLDPGSFGVFSALTGELPWPWTTTCELLRPGRAFPMAIPDTSEVRFVAVGQSGETAYCPGGLARRSNLNVTIWIERVLSDDQNRTALEGRIVTTSVVQVAPSDVARFRLSEGPILSDFFGAVVLQGPESRDEIEFRTWPRAITAADATELKRFEGGKLALCWCEFIPSLSSPYDLYSLSVLGARVLLSHKNNPLAKVVSDLERLGRAAGKHLTAGADLGQAAQALEVLLEPGAGGSRLGPQQMFGELPDAAKLAASIPPRMWAEAIAIVLRLTPGLGPVSQCADLGSGPEGGLHLPLLDSLTALEDLCARARSLVFSDWNANREVRTIFSKLREGR